MRTWTLAVLVASPLAPQVSAETSDAPVNAWVTGTPATSYLEPTFKIQSVAGIWDRGPHNAFTDLIRYRDHWVCAFREAPAHAGGVGDSRIVVLSSQDGQEWKPRKTLEHPQGDIRDAKLSITPSGELMLLTAIHRFDSTPHDPGGRKLLSLASFTTDLDQWTDLAEVTDDDYWLWGLQWHKGVGYSVGYRGDFTAHLYRTDDGRHFTRLVNSLDQHTGQANEAAITFVGDTGYCLLRTMGNAYIGQADAPYEQWVWKPLDQKVGGPDLIALEDGRLLAAGRLYLPGGAQKTSLLWIDADTGKVREALRLPSGGDTSYTGMVLHEGQLFISYYSSHEDKSCIYFARVDIVR